MADQDPITPAPEGNGQVAEEQPQASTIAQYIKDMSVESPSAPQVFQWQTQPSLDVQFGITGGKVGDDVHEIVLKIEVNAKSDSGTHFIVDLSYAGLFGSRSRGRSLPKPCRTSASRPCCSIRSISPAPICRRPKRSSMLKASRAAK